MKISLVAVLCLFASSGHSRGHHYPPLDQACQAVTLSGTPYYDEDQRVVDGDEIDRIRASHSFDSAWHYTKIPIKKIREIGFTKILRHIPQLRRYLDDKTSDASNGPGSPYKLLGNYLDSIISTPPMEPEGHQEKNELRQFLSYVHSPEDRQYNMKYQVDRRSTSLLCLSFTKGLRYSECYQGAKELAEKLQRGHNSDMIGEYFLYELLTTKGAARIVARTAKKAFARLWNPQDKSNLINDIQKSIKEEGVDDKNGDLLWDIVLASFIHGQNNHAINNYLPPYEYRAIHELVHALLALSVASVNLDSLYIDAGAPMYSFPKEVRSSCDNGKPYHFWVPAYMARYLRKKGKSFEDAQLSAFMIDLGYQITSSTLHRHPHTYLEDGALGRTNLKIRLDLAYAGAGAKYGALSIGSSNRLHSLRKQVEKKGLNINAAFDQSLKDGNNLKIKTMLDWVGGIAGTEALYYGRVAAMLNPWSILSHL